MNAILQANTIIKSKRQPQNLNRLLTRAKLDENIQIATINKCNRPNCGLCKCMIVGNSFTLKCGKTFLCHNKHGMRGQKPYLRYAMHGM